MLKPLAKQEQQKQREEAARKKKFTQFAKICQDIFGKMAQEKGKKAGIFERIRKITPEAWIQATVEAFGCDVSGTLENITDILKNNHKIHVTQAAVSDRLHDPKTQTFFKELIAHAMRSVIETEPNLLAIAKQFHGIYAGDCTTIALPEGVKDVFPGCGCQHENKGNAAMKIYFCTDLLHGTWKDMIFAPGKTSDQNKN